MATRRPKRRSSFSVIFWIAAILLIAIILVFNLPQIRDVLERTDFVEVVFEDETPAGEEVVEPVEEEVPSDGEDLPSVIEEPEAPPAEVVPEEPAPEETVVAIPSRPEERPDEPVRTVRTTLYFIRVTGDGRIVAEPVQRDLRAGTSPLTRTIEALLTGPGVDELNRGLLTLIPTGSRLLSARVENGIAFLNFSEEFRFNEMGLEGNIAQIQQIVLTATGFPTVSRVQILINGQRLDYLGGDGVYVGEPLSPADFGA